MNKPEHKEKNMNIFRNAAAATAALLLCTTAFGQNHKGRFPEKDDYLSYSRNEFYLQYGTPNIIESGEAIADRNITNGGHTFNPENYWFSGTPAIGYNRYVRHNISFGLYAGMAWGGMTMYSESGQAVYSCTTRSVNFMASGTYVYYRYGITELSGSIYLGISHVSQTPGKADQNVMPGFIPEKGGRTSISYHLTALKARFGETFGGFVELGFGYRGILNAGISLKI